MNTNDIISSGILELYALGLASPEEVAQVERWVTEYPEIATELEAIRGSLESYATAYSKEPPPSVKSRIMSAVGLDENDESEVPVVPLPDVAGERPVYRIPNGYKIAIAAMIVLLIGSIILNYSYYNRFKTTNENLQAANQKLARMDSANLAMNKDLDVITDKNARPVLLEGTSHAPDALAKIFWMKNTGDVYVDPSNLPAAPRGKQYQLWAIVDGKPVDAGMISTATGTYRIQKMKSFGKAEAFAITLENEGGSPTPTMDEMVVISKI